MAVFLPVLDNVAKKSWPGKGKMSFCHRRLNAGFAVFLECQYWLHGSCEGS